MKKFPSFVLGIHLICLVSSVISKEDSSRHPRQSNLQHGSQRHVKVENVDVQCSPVGISVSVEFDGPFEGLIYSKGYFANPKCRYLRANSGSRTFSFMVPANDCGTETSEGSLSNILIFQMDETIQEVWDIAKRISCKNSNGIRRQDAKKHGKTVIFKPLTVGMLDVSHQPFKSDGLNCWMDIQLGHFPNTVPIGGQVKIGEELSVIIYLQDEKRKYDVGVKDCWAFNNDNFDDPNTSKVQLTDSDGCVKKSKLIGNWMKTFETGDSGATTIAFTNMTAFKFPDSDNVHLTCNIEVCEDFCEETCKSNSGGVLPSTTAKSQIREPRPTSKSYLEPETSTTFVATRAPICYPNNFDSRCPKETRVSQFPATSDETEIDVIPGVKDKPRQEDETEEEILPGGYTPEPRTNEGYKPFPTTYMTTQRPFPTTTYKSTYEPTKQPLCYPGQIDPRCPPLCTPGSTDKRCYIEPEDEQEILPGGYTTTPRPPYTTRTPTTTVYTTKPPLCYPGQIDPRCPPICTPGSTDKRCQIEPEDEQEILPGGYTPTTARPTYRTTQRTLPTTTYKTTYPTTFATTRRPLCYPGQIDPRCPPVCTEGSTDKRCYVEPEDEQEILPGGYTTTPRSTYRTTSRTFPTTTYRYKTTYPTTVATTRQPLCYPGQIDPRCPPVCTSGSTDKRCYVEPEDEQKILPGGYTPTTPRPTYRTTSRTFPTTTYRTTYPTTYATTRQPLCYPGQIDPRCPPVCTAGSTDKRCYVEPEDEQEILPGGFTPSTPRPTYRTTPRTFPTTTYRTTYPTTYATTRQPLCYPGQIDPRCPPVCTQGSTDKRCYVEPEDEQEILPGGYTTTPRPTFRTTPRTLPTTTYKTTYPTTYATTRQQLCYPGQIDPRCPPVCTVGSTDKRCYVEPEDEQEILPGGYTTTPRPTYRTTPRTFPTTTYKTTYPTTYATTRQPLCYPGQIDPRCPPVCTSGSTDKRCYVEPEDEQEILPGGYTTTPHPTYNTTPRTFPTTTYKYKTTYPTTYATTRQPLCYPGQIDPRCPAVCTSGSTDKRCYVEPEDEQEILPGGYTPTTPRPTYRTTSRTFPTTTYRTTYPTTYATTRQPLCYPGQIDPRCPPVCSQGSTDKRCYIEPEDEQEILPGGYTPSTTPRPTYRTTYPSTTRPITYTTTTRTTQFQCYAGSLDPRCLQPTRRPSVYPTTEKPSCYPGQVDPRCPPICTAGSTDKRCKTEPEDEDDIQPGINVPSTTYRTTPRTTTYRTTPRTLLTTRRSTLPPRTIKPSVQPYSYPKPAKPFCYPSDPTCGQDSQYSQDSHDSQESRRYDNSQPKVQESKGPICYPGSFDPRCPKSARSNTNGDYDDPEQFNFESKRVSGEYY